MSQQSALPLKIAIATYGHTAALKQGQVPVAGVKPEFIEVKPIIAAFRRMVRDVEFDVCEMAPATYILESVLSDLAPKWVVEAMPSRERAQATHPKPARPRQLLTI